MVLKISKDVPSNVMRHDHRSPPIAQSTSIAQVPFCEARPASSPAQTGLVPAPARRSRRLTGAGSGILTGDHQTFNFHISVWMSCSLRPMRA